MVKIADKSKKGVEITSRNRGWLEEESRYVKSMNWNNKAYFEKMQVTQMLVLSKGWHLPKYTLGLVPVLNKIVMSVQLNF